MEQTRTAWRHSPALGNSRAFKPPPHVLEGCAKFFCGKDRFIADAGDCVFIPRGVPHTMTFLTPSVRALAVVSAVAARPVTLDQFFLLMSAPARSLDLPALSPDEACKLMPGYPGSGAVLAGSGRHGIPRHAAAG